MAYIDDYTAWIIGSSASKNTRMLQSTVLPRLEQWECESGAIFEASKTAFVHFTRNTRGDRHSDLPLSFKGQAIAPTPRAKLLGVIMDSKLRFRSHVAKAAARAQEAALAVKRLKGLRPKAIRQMVTAVVWPVADYASPVWYPRSTDSLVKRLYAMQRTSVQAFICSFRTVALPIAEAEAGVKQLCQRLLDQCLQFWMSIHALDSSHPLATARRVQPRRRFPSALQEMAARFEKVNASNVAAIDPVAVAPWVTPIKTVIKDKDKALEDADKQTPRTIDVYTDASIRNGVVGIGIFEAEGTQLAKTIAQANTATVLMAELAAIWVAADIVCGRVWDPGISSQIRIMTDCKAAVRAIAWPRRNQNQELVASIYQTIGGRPVSVHWIPGHSENQGNQEANKLAKSATAEGSSTPPARRLAVPLSIAKSVVKGYAIKPDQDAFATSTTGQYTKRIDRALPGKHTRILYDNLTGKEAAVLSQLRTGRARINKYLAKIGAAESELCEHCQQVESIPHLLFTCSKWEHLRADIRAEHGERYGELSYALGGYNNVRLDGESTLR